MTLVIKYQLSLTSEVTRSLKEYKKGNITESSAAAGEGQAMTRRPWQRFLLVSGVSGDAEGQPALGDTGRPAARLLNDRCEAQAGGVEEINYQSVVTAPSREHVRESRRAHSSGGRVPL